MTHVPVISFVAFGRFLEDRLSFGRMISYSVSQGWQADGGDKLMKELLSREEIQRGVERLAAEIGLHYEGRPVTIIGVMTGSIVLLADVIRRIDLPLRVGVIQTRSYRGAAVRPGQLEINDSMLPDIRGRDVLLLDDIFDTGHTLANLISRIAALGPRSVRSAVLLRKLGRCE